jgi:hypothetical protein
MMANRPKTQEDTNLVQLVFINYKAHTQARPGIVSNRCIYDPVSRFSAVFHFRLRFAYLTVYISTVRVIRSEIHSPASSVGRWKYTK